MRDIVTLYFSMFRQNASGSYCGMITTGDPTIIAKGSSSTTPVNGILNLSLQKREDVKTYRRCDRKVGSQVTRPFPSAEEEIVVGS